MLNKTKKFLKENAALIISTVALLVSLLKG